MTEDERQYKEQSSENTIGPPIFCY